MSDYVTVVALTIVGYDYILTIPDEIEYIWNNPWSRVSALFVLARYFGLCFSTINALMGSSFLPGAQKQLITFNSCSTFYVSGTWAAFIFAGAAELVMILRVWALHSRSRFILGILLTSYAVEILGYVAWCITISSQSGGIVDTAQVSNFLSCLELYSPRYWFETIHYAQIVLGASMCLLIGVQLIKESLQMYGVTKRLQPSRYMIVLLREGLMYFVAILLFAIMGLLAVSANFPSGWPGKLLATTGYVPAVVLVPRFVLGLRRLYACELQRRRGSNIDTAFGSTTVAGRGTAASAVMFAGAGQDEGEEIPMEDMRIGGAG